jgi:hypothetical protein
MRRRKFSREFKIEAVKLVRERGVSAAQAARDLGNKKYDLSKRRRVRVQGCRSKGVNDNGSGNGVARGDSDPADLGTMEDILSQTRQQIYVMGAGGGGAKRISFGSGR